MSDLYNPDAVVSLENQNALRQLERLLTFSQGEYSLILAHCNYNSLRQKTLQQLQQSSLKLRTIKLDPSARTLYTTIVQELKQEKPDAVIVLGLESVSDLDQLLIATNQAREQFRSFTFPVVLWVTDKVLKKLIRLIPDFYSWATTVVFELTTDELIELIQKTTDEVFNAILDSCENIFLDNVALHLEQDSPRYTELQSASEDLRNRGVKLASETEAGLEFVMGRAADNSQTKARKHYKRSLALYRHTSNLVRCGHVLFSLGLWWRGYAVRHHAKKERACHLAKKYFQQTIEVFEQADRSDLAARFINYWAEVIHRLNVLDKLDNLEHSEQWLEHPEKWDELERVATKALNLHQTHVNQFRQARAYGFLAEAAIGKSDWIKAEKYAQTALDLFNQAQQAQAAITHPTSEQQSFLDWQRSFTQGWYLFSRAQAERRHLDRIPAAIDTLKQAKTVTKPRHDPALYILILSVLHDVYYQQREYWLAFENKQEQQDIENQYGFRTFIGAGQLPGKKHISTPALPFANELEETETVPEEITGSARSKDVNRLVERVGRDDCKLTVIHGQSGVGKSSLIKAGLILKLQQERIATRKVLPILQRSYDDWAKELYKNLVENKNLENSLEEEQKIKLIFEQLEINRANNRITVLIFDQFEEFFSERNENEKREVFYNFLRRCLEPEQVYVKIFLSLREDYLHFLLDFERYLENFYSENKLPRRIRYILDDRVLYHLDDFSKEEARALIKELNTKTQFSLEEPLIERLIQDLAQKTGRVRPIELQVIGAQLQKKKITKLKQYQEFEKKQKEPKIELVNSYIEEVIKDCGEENQKIAELVLYLLTDETNLRPRRTKNELQRAFDELEESLLKNPEKLDLVLKIFIGSKLVVFLKEISDERYQLVHDYLVSFIKNRRGREIKKELEENRKQLKQAEKQLTRNFIIFSIILGQTVQFQKFLIKGLFLILVLIVCLTIYVIYQANQRRIAEINANYQADQRKIAKLNANYQLLVEENEQLEAFKNILKAGMFIEQNAQSEDEKETVAHLWRAINLTQERNLLKGHERGVKSISISPDNQLIASASTDKTIKLWGQHGKVESFTNHSDRVNSIDFSPYGQLIASASDDKTIKLWTKKQNKIYEYKKTILTSEQVNSVSFNPNHKYKIFVTGNSDGTIQLWDYNGNLIKTWQGHKKKKHILSVSFSHDGKIIASAGNDAIIKLWNLDGTLFQEKPLTGHTEAVWSVNFSLDSELIASASDDDTVKLWKKEKGEYIYDYDKELEKRDQNINSVTFNPKYKMIASGGTDGIIKLWNYDGTLISTLSGHRNAINQIRFTSDGKNLVSASADKSIRVWELDGILPEVLNVFKPSDKILGRGASFSPDGKILAAASDTDQNKIKLWQVNWQKDKVISYTDHQKQLLEKHKAPINSISFSSDGQFIVSADDDGNVILWQRQQNESYQYKKMLINTEIPLTKKSPINSVSFGCQDQCIAAAGNDGKVILLQKQKAKPEQYTEVRSFNHGSEQVRSVSFSDNDNLLASSDDKTVKLWNPLKGTRILTLYGKDKLSKDEAKGFWSISFNPKSSLIAAATENGYIKLWRRDNNFWEPLDIKTTPIGLAHERNISKVSFSSDGQYIASASTDGTVKIWNSEGEFIATLQEGSEYVESVNFNPISNFLISIDSANIVRTWNLSYYPLEDRLNNATAIKKLFKDACSEIDDYLQYKLQNNQKVKKEAQEDKDLIDFCTKKKTEK